MNNKQMKNEQQALQDLVDHIAETICNGMTFEDAGMDHEENGAESTDLISGFDYLSDLLDIEYTISSNGEYLGARILVAFGGPNIWINTRTRKVEGYWWGDEATATYTDEMELHSICEELWDMRG